MKGKAKALFNTSVFYTYFVAISLFVCVIFLSVYLWNLLIFWHPMPSSVPLVHGLSLSQLASQWYLLSLLHQVVQVQQCWMYDFQLLQTKECYLKVGSNFKRRLDFVFFPLVFRVCDKCRLEHFHCITLKYSIVWNVTAQPPMLCCFTTSFKKYLIVISCCLKKVTTKKNIFSVFLDIF